jgi:hypothetical protein
MTPEEQLAAAADRPLARHSVGTGNYILPYNAPTAADPALTEMPLAPHDAASPAVSAAPGVLPSSQGVSSPLRGVAFQRVCGLAGGSRGAVAYSAGSRKPGRLMQLATCVEASIDVASGISAQQPGHTSPYSTECPCPAPQLSYATASAVNRFEAAKQKGRERDGSIDFGAGVKPCRRSRSQSPPQVARGLAVPAGVRRLSPRDGVMCDAYDPAMVSLGSSTVIRS